MFSFSDIPLSASFIRFICSDFPSFFRQVCPSSDFISYISLSPFLHIPRQTLLEFAVICSCKFLYFILVRCVSRPPFLPSSPLPPFSPPCPNLFQLVWPEQKESGCTQACYLGTGLESYAATAGMAGSVKIPLLSGQSCLQSMAPFFLGPVLFIDSQRRSITVPPNLARLARTLCFWLILAAHRVRTWLPYRSLLADSC